MGAGAEFDEAAGAEILHRALQAHAAGKRAEAAAEYGRALEIDGRSGVALLGLSLLARQSGQREAALRMAAAALECATSRGRAALALAHAGYCLAGLGRWREAEGAFRRVLAGGVESRTGETRVGQSREEQLVLGQSRLQAGIGLGDELVAAGRASEAAAAYRMAIDADPGWAGAHFGLGNAQALAEDWGGALGSFGRVMEMRPDCVEAHFGAAFCRGKLGDSDGAIGAYRRAIELRPGFAGAWLNLGVSLVGDGRDGLGEMCYREVLRITSKRGAEDMPTRISALLNRGHLERGRKRFAAALRAYGEALDVAEEAGGASKSRMAEIHLAFCSWHLEQGQFPQAWRALRLTEKADEANGEVANTRGILLLGEEQGSGGRRNERLIEEAIAAFREAEGMGHRTAASNRGNALLRQGRCEEALQAHELAVERNPMHAGARYNLALTQLRRGDFRWGWLNYEARWAFRDVHRRPRRFGVPRWEGEARGTVLVYAEQGLGDTVQFARYLPLAADRLMAEGGPAGMVVEAQEAVVRVIEPLVRELESRYDRLQTLVITAGKRPPEFGMTITAHCALMSLPALFGTEEGAIPGAAGYLAKCARAEGARRDGRLAVGVAWAGNPDYKADGERSTRLETLLPLLSMAGIGWVSLQKGPEVATEIAAVVKRLPEGWNVEDGCSVDRDLADTAEVIAGLDLVITTDTVIAHLAGAMGKPVWILLAWQGDWRWMQERETSPWYRTARLFRQARRGDWAGLVERVRGELEAVKCAGQMGGVGL